jgi:hypothetical protein
MAVKHSDFVFVEETFDVDEYPAEIKPTQGSDRFPVVPPRAKADEKILSKPMQLFQQRLAEENGIDPEHVDVRLLRTVEAADGWPDQNVRNFSTGRVRSISTERGEIRFVDFVANPLALTHDPNNGRTIADARAKRLPYLEAAGDDPLLHTPIIVVEDAPEFVQAVQESARSLGFTDTVAPGSKDLNDINWVGLQGVHEPTLVAPIIVRDTEGHMTWALIVLDGNRRLAMQRRILREALGFSTGDVESWSDHFLRADGKIELRPVTAKDVVAVRRKALFKDMTGAYWQPSSGAEDVVEKWLADAGMAQRTVARNRVIPVRLIVGYRNVTTADGERSAAMEAIHRYVRRTHIAEAAQQDWSEETQSMQVALDAMRKMQVRAPQTKGYTMPLSEPELAAVYSNKIVAWSGADPEDSAHPLRLGAKVLATFVCDDHTASFDVRQSLVAHSMSVHHTKVRENRAEVGAVVTMPILGIEAKPGSRSAYNRAEAVIDRMSRHPMFAAVKRHPKGEPWWAFLGLPMDELLDLVRKDLAGIVGDAGSDEKSVGPWGGPSRALIFLAGIAQTTNPMFEPNKGEAAALWQLTLNGLGNTRGESATTPDLIIQRVLVMHREKGAEQLAEMVQAALERRLPANVIVPEYDPTTKGYLTEEFLRSAEHMGWDPTSGRPKSGSRDPYTRTLEQIEHALNTAAGYVKQVLDTGKGAGGGAVGEPSLAERFWDSGLPETYTSALLPVVEELRDFLRDGQLTATRRARAAASQAGSGES